MTESKLIEIKLQMPIKSFNLNQITNTNRGNRYAGASAKKKAMQAIYLQLKDQVKEKLKGKYHVYAKWLVTSKNRDLDNLLLKNIFDCMQENDLLDNDNLNHIVKITHEFDIVKKEDEGVIVRFEEAE